MQWRVVEESALSEDGVDKLLLIETPENTIIKIGKYDRKIGKWLVDDAPVTNVTKWMDISELLKVNTKNI